jgi:hypothetical protein
MSDPVVDALSAMLRESHARERQLGKQLAQAHASRAHLVSSLLVLGGLVGLGWSLFRLARLGAGV